MIWLLLIPFAYQFLAWIACILWLRHRDPAPTSLPPISILKPVKGNSPGFYEAIRSHAQIDYPNFELLFGIASEQDPAHAVVERLISEFPAIPIRILLGSAPAHNAKVGRLITLERAASHEILVVNDGDISVPRDYLRQITAPLNDPTIGLVTCLYRPTAHSFPGKFEAIGVATDFVPSTLVARLLGIVEFGLGSTLCFRRADFNATGGFEAIADYIADDYQLGARLHKSGKRVYLSRTVVSTELPAETWSDAWQHQIRWMRTIRVSRDGLIGYLGLPVTFATLWALTALPFHPIPAITLLAMRALSSHAASRWVLKTPFDLLTPLLVPARDLWAVCLWVTGLFGSEVHWAGRRLRLRSDGKITPDLLK